jgi:general secretion pathway protein G/type IV pilus assembly protein PilA
MKCALVIILGMVTAGCGVELLTTTAIQGELQAEQLKALKGQTSRAAGTMGKTNLEHALQLYQADKGRNPASLDELAPNYIERVPVRADGKPYGYDPVSGKLLDTPGSPAPAVRGPTPNDLQKMNQITSAVNQYGTAIGWYPPSLAALVPTYLQAVPKTDSGEDFIFYPENGALFHPAQLQQPQQSPAAPTPPPATVARPIGGGAGPMGEVVSGIGVQNQLNSMGNSGVNSAGGYARRSTDGATQQHNAAQEKALNELGM